MKEDSQTNQRCVEPGATAHQGGALHYTCECIPCGIGLRTTIVRAPNNKKQLDATKKTCE